LSKIKATSFDEKEESIKNAVPHTACLQFFEDILVNENYKVCGESFLNPQTFCESIIWLLHFDFFKGSSSGKSRTYVEKLQKRF